MLNYYQDLHHKTSEQKIHVYWLAQTTGDVPAGDDWMAAGEAARLNAMHIPKRRSDFRLGRWTARQALTACPDVSTGAVEVRARAGGAPEVLINGAPARCTVSISHSAGAALCAISPMGANLGCDIEVVEPRGPEFVETFYTEREQFRVKNVPEDERALLTTIIWSAKESASKMLGVGLRLDTRSVEVSLLAGEPAGPWNTLEVTCDEGRMFHGWWRLQQNHILTIIASPPPAVPLELATGVSAS
jgi:4'-phosphopantetheinyl transferase